MKKIGLVIGILAVVLFTTVTILQAQEDTTALCDKVQVIDAKLGRKLTPFKHYKRFSQAVLKQEESGYQYEVYFSKSKVEQKSVTELQLHTLCEEINLLNKPEMPNIRARNRLAFSTAVYTTIFYSELFEELLGNPFGTDPIYKIYKPIYGAGIGLMAYLVAPKNGITDGMASAYSMGTGLGFLHALLMEPEGVDFIYPIPVWGFFDTDEGVYTENLPTKFALSVVEGVGFTLLAKYNNYTWGQTSSIGSGGMWGALYGGLIIDINDTENKQFKRIAGYSSRLLFSAAGVVGGNYLYNKRGLTRGDVTVINSYGVVGYDFGFLLGAFIPNRVVPLLGSLAGLGIGINRTWNYSYTRSQGNQIAIAGILGWSLSQIIDKESLLLRLFVTPVATSLGIIGSDLLLRRASSRSTDFASNLQLQFNPMGLVNAFEVNPNLTTHQPWDYRYQNSLVSLSLTF